MKKKINIGNTLPIVKDVCDRKKLIEGRNYQMGFAFCKQTLNGSFETIQPISPCKDYLNDVIYTEHTGRDFSACGLITTKQGIFESGPFAYIAIQMLKPKGEGWFAATTFDEYKATLSKNYKNIETLLNYIEDTFSLQGTTDRTSITLSQNPDIFLLAVPVWWCRTTHLISLYSLFVRMAQFWDGTGSPQKFLDTYNNPLDNHIWNPSYGAKAKNNYACMLKYGITLRTPMEQYERNPLAPAVHGCGILAY